MGAYKDEINKKSAENDEKVVAYEKRLQGLSKAVENNRCGTAAVKNELHKSEAALRLENERLKNIVHQQIERINALEIMQNKLHINIDGVPEDSSVSPSLLIITKFNNDTEADLKESDIKSAWRIGTVVPDEKDIPALKGKTNPKTQKVKRKPRTIYVILASEQARDYVKS